MTKASNNGRKLLAKPGITETTQLKGKKDWHIHDQIYGTTKLH
jgi:hypothetical protein